MIAVISDTHLPRGSRRLPEACLALLGEAEAIVHAGDLCTLEVLTQLRGLGGPVHAVHGNVDDAATRAALPASTRLRHGGHLIAVTHDAGPRAGRGARLARRFPDAELVIFGHSHLPLHVVGADGRQILNPGSPTDRRRSPHHTMALLHVDRDGALRAEIVALDGPGADPAGVAARLAAR